MPQLIAGKAMVREAVRARNLEAAPVAAGEQRRLAFAAAAPDGADSVDDVSRGQIVPPGQLRVAGRAAAEPGAFLQQPRAGGAVDRPVHPAAAQQRRIGRIDDRVDVEPGNVAAPDLNPLDRHRHLPAIPPHRWTVKDKA